MGVNHSKLFKNYFFQRFKSHRSYVKLDSDPQKMNADPQP